MYKKVIVLLVLLGFSLLSYSEVGIAYKDYQKLDKQEILCVVNVIKYEARPSFSGRRSVFDIVFNRSKKFDKSYCQIILAKSQFSFIHYHWDKKLTEKDLKIYYDIVVVGEPVVTDEDVLWYHADSIKNPWKGMKRMGRYDGNIFYKKHLHSK